MDELGNRIKSLRKAINLSLMELSDRAGCSASYLSMVENSKVDPSISKLKQIAEGLGITINDLFRDESRKDVIIRKADRVKIAFPQSKTDIEILTPDMPDRALDARMVIIQPEGSSEGGYRHEGEEFGLIYQGNLELTISGQMHLLQPGDSFYFKSTKDHSFRNPGKEETRVVWVNQPPRS